MPYSLPLTTSHSTALFPTIYLFFDAPAMEATSYVPGPSSSLNRTWFLLLTPNPDTTSSLFFAVFFFRCLSYVFLVCLTYLRAFDDEKCPLHKNEKFGHDTNSILPVPVVRLMLACCGGRKGGDVNKYPGREREGGRRGRSYPQMMGEDFLSRNLCLVDVPNA